MLTQTILIPHATAKAIYDILLDSKLHTKLTGAKAAINAQVGGKFVVFDGYANGETTKLIPNQLIEQTWRASDWPAGHYSKIVFKLKDQKDGAEIRFTQTDLPKGTEGEFEQGWHDNYWTPLKQYFA